MIARVGRKEKNRRRDRDDESRDRGRRKKGGFKFKYRERDPETIKKRAEQTGGTFDSPVKRGVDMWRPKSGENAIRILPPTWEDFDHFGYEVFMHRWVGSDNSNYVCPNKMKGKKCCICDEAKEMKADGEDEEAKRLGFQKRVWVWIIDRDDKDATPQIFDMSWSQDRDIAESSKLRGGKVLHIDHPEAGYDVLIKKTGSGKNGTKYHISIDREESPIHEDSDKQDEILQYITENPVPEVLHIFGNDHLMKKMEGASEDKDEDLDDDEDDEDDDKKSKKSKSKGRKRSTEDDDDDDDEDDEADDDGDDEDDRPKRSKSKSKSKSRRDRDDDDDDDADDDDDDEDDDDDRPRRSKSKKSNRRDEADDDDDDDDDDDRSSRRKKRR